MIIYPYPNLSAGSAILCLYGMIVLILFRYERHLPIQLLNDRQRLGMGAPLIPD